MKVGSLFSGGGLGDLGFMMAGMEIAFQVEINEYCQKILNLRWPDVPKWKDIKNVKGSDLPAVDIITGGFPCQSFSVAGQQRGKEDSRYLWPEMFRIIREVRPRWVIGENVPGIIGIALDDVLSDLESSGYETTTLVFPAHVVPPQVPHRRERVWILAHTRRQYGEGQEITGEPYAAVKKGNAPESERSAKRHRVGDATHSKVTKCEQSWNPRSRRHGSTNPCEFVADASSDGCDRHTKREPGRKEKEGRLQEFMSRDWREAESRIRRVVDGCANRVGQLKMLGNGQVVAVTAWIGKRIMEYEAGKK